MADNPVAGQIWQHRKIGHNYRILDVATNCTNGSGAEPMVVYKLNTVTQTEVFVRELEEFKDKFTENIPN